jgi:hypothetical protein
MLKAKLQLIIDDYSTILELYQNELNELEEKFQFEEIDEFFFTDEKSQFVKNIELMTSNLEKMKDASTSDDVTEKKVIVFEVLLYQEHNNFLERQKQNLDADYQHQFIDEDLYQQQKESLNERVLYTLEKLESIQAIS